MTLKTKERIAQVACIANMSIPVYHIISKQAPAYNYLAYTYFGISVILTICLAAWFRLAEQKVTKESKKNG